MSRIKRVVAFLSVVVLVASLVGCKKKENGQDGTATSNEVIQSKEQETSDPSVQNTNNETKEGVDGATDIGKYVETELKIPEFEKDERMIASFLSSNGQLEVYTVIQSGAKRVVNSYVYQGDKIEKKPVEWANKALQDASGIYIQFGKIEEGRYFLFVQDVQNLDGKDESFSYITSRIFENAQNGTDYMEITPKDWNQKEVFTNGTYGTYANSVQISKEGIMTYRLGFDSLLYAYSTKDQASINIGDIDVDFENPYVLKNNCIYYVAKESKEIAIYNLNTKETKTISNQFNLQYSAMQVDEKGKIYLLNHEGIHCFREGGTMWETILDGASYTISSPNKFFNNFHIQDGEYQTYYIYFTDQKSGEEKLTSYRFNTDATITETVDLSIYSLRENKTIRQAIIGFKAMNPGINIEYYVAMTKKGELNITDEIRSLNTELLAGKGADILLLEGLPIDTYIEKDVLLDLSDMLTPMIEDGTLTSNVANNYITENGIFAMPIRYFVPIYLTEQDAKAQMDSMKSLSEMCQTLDKKVFPQMRYDQLLQLFLYTYYDEFMLDKKTMDANAFSNFLNEVKIVSENIDIWDETRGYSSDAGINSLDNLAVDIFSSSAFNQLIEHTFAQTGYAGDISDFNSYDACAKHQDGDITSINNSFMPSGIVAINKMTKSEELAKEFITYLFSEEAQSTRNDDGFPLHANSLEAWCNIETLESEQLMVGKTDIYGEMIPIIILGTSIEEKQELKELILNCETPIFSDENVLNMIMEQSLGYLTGVKTLEQAVNDTTSKINLYLLEQ